MSVQAIRDLIEAVRDERAATGQPASDLDYIAAEVDALAAVVAERDALRAARDEAVSIALWLAAIDAVPITERIEWVASLAEQYDHYAARRVLAGEAAPSKTDPGGGGAAREGSESA